MAEKRPGVSRQETPARFYARPEKIQRYRESTAGRGKHFMLRTAYVPLFFDEALAALSDTGAESLRTIEVGCGAGLASRYLAEKLRTCAVDVELMVGADLVPEMIDAARQDVADYGSDWARERLRFVVARHEALAADVPAGLGMPAQEVDGFFHLAISLATFRYAFSQAIAEQTAWELKRILSPGGRVVVIDMNDRFPYGVRSALHRRVRLRVDQVRARTQALPTLDEYARPFEEAGFDIVRKGYLGWVPHSANGFQFWVTRASSAILARLAPTRAMRSVVVAKKPACHPSPGTR